jgi:hypothetical protein
MDGQQMMLFSADEALTVMSVQSAGDAYVEEDLDIETACQVAKAYGRQHALFGLGWITLRKRLIKFVDDLAIIYEFDADDRELLRNYAFAGAHIAELDLNAHN